MKQKLSFGRITRKGLSFLTAFVMVFQIIISAFNPMIANAASATNTPRDKKLYSDKNEGKSLEEYLGISRNEFVKEASKRDKYYGLHYYQQVPGFDSYSGDGQPADGTGLNCIRFLTDITVNAGGNYNKFKVANQPKETQNFINKKDLTPSNNLFVWMTLMGIPYKFEEVNAEGQKYSMVFKKNETPKIPKVRWYKYDSPKDLLNDGKVKKGDWIFVVPEGGALYDYTLKAQGKSVVAKDAHSGIYWGGKEGEDLALNIAEGKDVAIEDLLSFGQKGHNQKPIYYVIPFDDSDIPQAPEKISLPIQKTVDGELPAGQSLEGVQYIASNKDDKKERPKIAELDKNGKGTFRGLSVDANYEIKEHKSKPFLTHDNKTYEVYTKDNGMKEIVLDGLKVSDKLVEGSIKVNKDVSVFSENSLSAKGTEFRLYDQEIPNGATLEELNATGIKPIATISYDPSDANGNKFTNLDINKTYYVAEGQPTLGLVRDRNVHKVNLNVQGDSPEEQVESVNMNVNFTNEELYFTGSFKFEKRDKQLMNTQSPMLQGDATYEDMRLKLTLQVEKDGNYVDSKSWTVKMPESGVLNLDNSIKDLKVDGPEFYEKDGNVVWPAGRIKVEEINAPEGYNIDSDDNSVAYITLKPIQHEPNPAEVDLAGDKSLANTVKRGHFELAKFEGTEDCYNEEGVKLGLENAEFAIINSSKNPVVTLDNKIIEPGQEFMRFKTDEFGFFATKDLNPEGVLPFGTYTLHEVDTGREDLAPIKDTKFQITEDKQIIKLIAEDKLIAAPLRVVKKDAETGKTIPAANTEFRILDKDKNPVQMIIRYPNNKILDTFKTDESGTVQLPSKLAKGKYYIEEVNAPEGYALSKEPVAFEITEMKDWGEPVEVEFSNKPQKVQVNIKKSIESYLGKDLTSEENEKVLNALKQAKFDVIAKEDVTLNGDVKVKAGESAGTYGLDDNLTAITDPLYPGKYIVKETNVPEGVIVPEKEVLTLDLKADHSKQEQEVLQFNTEVKNYVNGTTINKVDKENHDIKLANVEFELWKEGSDNKQKVVTDENGQITVQALDNGVWNLKETKTIFGYVLNTNTFKFTVDENTHKVDCEDITIENIKTKVNLRKTDEDDKDLEGAWMTLLDSNGESIDPNKYLDEENQVETRVFKNQEELDKVLKEEREKALNKDNELKEDTLKCIITQSTQNIKNEDAKNIFEETFKKDITDEKVLKAIDMALESGKENNFQIDMEKAKKEHKDDEKLLEAIADVNKCLSSKYMNPNAANEAYGEGMCLNPNASNNGEEEIIEDRQIIVWKSTGKDMILKGLPIGHYIYAEVKAPETNDKYTHYEIAPLRQITVQGKTEVQEFKIENRLLNLEKPCIPEKPTHPNKPNKPNKPEKGSFQEKHVYIIRDENGKEIGREEIDGDKLTGTSKDEYSTSKKDKDGYKLVKVTSDNGVKYDKNGKKVTNNFVNGKDQSVTYIYEKVKKSPEKPEKGSFQEKHIYIIRDKDGKEIGREEIDGDKLTGTSKDEYSSEKKDKDGYKLVKVESKTDTKFDKEGKKVTNNFVEGKDEEITYIYEKVQEEPKENEGSFQEHHIYITKDKDGKEIDRKAVIGEKFVGTEDEEYTTSKKDKDGFKFVEAINPVENPEYDKDGKETKGKFEAGKDKEISYVYEKVAEEDKTPAPEEPEKPEDNEPKEEPKKEQGPGKDLPETSARQRYTKDNTIAFILGGFAVIAISAFAGYKIYNKNTAK